MRSYLAVSALMGLAAAAPAPVPQDIDFDLVYALPNPSYTTVTGATVQTVVFDPTSVLEAALPQITSSSVVADATFVKRAACDPQPTGATGAPTLTADTVSAFTANADFASLALAAPTPSGYVQTFQNLQASNK